MPRPFYPPLVEPGVYVKPKGIQKIKAIIEDDSLEDRECFMKIEEIVRAFEELGSSGGTRHDFG